MVSNPLTPVWEAYKVSKNCFKVTRLANKHPVRHALFEDTDFLTKDETEVLEILGKSLKESEDLFVIGLWANFERFVRTYIQNKGVKLQEVSPVVLGDSLYWYFEEEVNFWQPDDILERVLKNTLSPSTYLIGQAKQILKYRNWIAHGKNPNKTVAKITQVASQVINDIINILLVN